MKSILGLYGVCIAYSVVRYIVFAPKNIENLPVFIVNKGTPHQTGKDIDHRVVRQYRELAREVLWRTACRDEFLRQVDNTSVFMGRTSCRSH